MLDVRRLRIFVAVAEEGSFTAAAHRLYLTQSAVSQQMSILEREVGVALLQRVRRGVRLTAAGEALAVRAGGLFGEIATIEREIATFSDGPTEIRLGTFATAGVELLPLALKAFVSDHPEVSVQLSSVQADDAATRLRDGDIHALLMWDYDFAPQPMDPALTRLRLPDDPLRVVLPIEHPLTSQPEIALTELADERWVVRSHRPPYTDAYETMCRIAGFEPNIVFRTDDYPSMQGLIAAGMGIGVAPALSASLRRHDVAIRPLSEPRFARRVTALTLPEVDLGSPIADLLDALRRAAEELISVHAEHDLR